MDKVIVLLIVVTILNAVVAKSTKNDNALITNGKVLRQDCSSDKFSCQYNDPCSPTCNDGQTIYPGNWNNKWIQCAGTDNAYCTENRCPRLTYWNQENLRCEDKDGVEARCAFGKFDCADRNPCNPGPCTVGILKYPGHWHNKYVVCDGCGGCLEQKCDPLFIWDQNTQECILKPVEDNRCNVAAFDCTKNNPCDPEVCVSGKNYYAAVNVNQFVQCGAGTTCYVLPCAPGTVWDDENQSCNFPS